MKNFVVARIDEEGYVPLVEAAFGESFFWNKLSTDASAAQWKRYLIAYLVSRSILQNDRIDKTIDWEYAKNLENHLENIISVSYEGSEPDDVSNDLTVCYNMDYCVIQRF